MSSSAEPESGSCLVARAMPSAPTPATLVDALSPELVADSDDAPKTSDANALAASLCKLSVNSNNTAAAALVSGAVCAPKKPSKTADPADFVTLQSLRSSALARKTNTTSKFGRDGAALFADLLHGDDADAPTPAVDDANSATAKTSGAPPATEKLPTTSAKTIAAFLVEAQTAITAVAGVVGENAESELLSRGPVRAARAPTAYHPYTEHQQHKHYSPAAYDSPVADYQQQPPYGAYAAAAQWQMPRDMLSSSSSTPDTVLSDLGYSSSSASPQTQQSSGGGSCGGGGVGDYAAARMHATSATKKASELPDILCDFILKYSKNYCGQNGEATTIVAAAAESNARPSSTDSNLCDSPLTAVSAPQSSPAAPRGGLTSPSTPLSDYRGAHKMGALRTQLPSSQYASYVMSRANGSPPAARHLRPAKEVLRSLIRGEDMDDAWAWTSKCLQSYPGALYFQDHDRDTLLHIVTCHLDLGKIYALVEQMLKTDYPTHQRPFDMCNRLNETPLFFAVEKNHNELVDFLLEAGADPNTQNSRPSRDAPLHFAASRGFAELVKTICSYDATNLNLGNGRGLTPLLCAVQAHGTLDETRGYVDNAQCIGMLLKFGADPLIADATNGRTAIHYAIDAMSPEIIEVFKNNIEEETMSKLVNMADYNRETPIDSLQLRADVDESTRFKLGMSLVVCGGVSANSAEH